MDKTQWTDSILRAYAAGTKRLAYGCWRVEKLKTAFLFDGEVWRHEKEGWQVKDLKGNVVAVVRSEELAALIALLPDLCDVDLRGTGAGSVRGEYDAVEDRTIMIKLCGVADPQEAYEIGFHEAWKSGIDEGYGLAKQEFEDADTDSIDVEEEERGPHGCLTVGWRNRPDVKKD